MDTKSIIIFALIAIVIASIIYFIVKRKDIQKFSNSFMPPNANIIPIDYVNYINSKNVPITYGSTFSLLGLSNVVPGFNQYLSNCGNAFASTCGRAVSLMTDEDFNQHEPDSLLRSWRIFGGVINSPVKYGDQVMIRSLKSSKGSVSGYLAPCGTSGSQGCGVGISVLDKSMERTISYTGSYEISYETQDKQVHEGWNKWMILGGPLGTIVHNGDKISLKFENYNLKGYLTPCGMSTPDGCGVKTSLISETEATWSDVNRVKWKIGLLF